MEPEKHASDASVEPIVSDPVLNRIALGLRNLEVFGADRATTYAKMSDGRCLRVDMQIVDDVEMRALMSSDLCERLKNETAEDWG